MSTEAAKEVAEAAPAEVIAPLGLPPLKDMMEPKAWDLGLRCEVRCIETPDFTKTHGPRALGFGAPKYKATLKVYVRDLKAKLNDRVATDIFLRLAGPRYNKDKGYVTISASQLPSLVVSSLLSPAPLRLLNLPPHPAPLIPFVPPSSAISPLSLLPPPPRRATRTACTSS